MMQQCSCYSQNKEIIAVKPFDLQLQRVAAVALYIYILTEFMSTTYSFEIDLIPRTSIDSNLFPKHLTHEETHHRIASLSRTHTHHLSSMNSAKSARKQSTPRA